MRKMKYLVRGYIVFCLLVPALHADSLDDLATDFWTWRASERPVNGDDVPRLERPEGWVPDASMSAVERNRKQLEEFEVRWRKMDATAWPVGRQVDYRLMGSAMARVRWELDILRSWQRNPEFYVDQTLGALYELLVVPPPFDAARTRYVVAMLNSFPHTLNDAERNLAQPAAPFAELAIGQLREIRPRLLRSVHELKPFLDPEASRDLDSTAERAASALESYRNWLAQRLPDMPGETAIGRDAYIFFLKNVALAPFTPEQLLAAGRQEWARAVASQVYEEHHNLGMPQLALFKNQAEQMAHEEKDELAVRRYLEEKDLLTVPAWVQHYRYTPTPPYLVPLGGISEADDFTGPSRLKQDGIRYIDPPSPNLGYFWLSVAKDPRPIIVHEGVPGHYFQLVLSWANPDPIRRHYYDSSANEGIGFYAEEMMLNAGLFDDSPRTQEIIWNFMRLRALRVEVDVKLALGQFTIDQAAEYLKTAVPMDAKTAHSEAAAFASGPGGAISYQVGKLQIYRLLADAHRAQGQAFSLRALHDFLWLNGNVPIALLRWEYLGKKDEIEAVERLQ